MSKLQNQNLWEWTLGICSLTGSSGAFYALWTSDLGIWINCPPHSCNRSVFLEDEAIGEEGGGGGGKDSDQTSQSGDPEVIRCGASRVAVGQRLHTGSLHVHCMWTTWHWPVYEHVLFSFPQSIMAGSTPSPWRHVILKSWGFNIKWPVVSLFLSHEIYTCSQKLVLQRINILFSLICL